jgi:hypothetical protein
MKNQLIALIILLQLSAAAQPRSVSLTITEGAQNEALKRVIEENASYLLTTVNLASLNSFPELMLDEQRFMDEAVQKVKKMWDEARFYSAASTISERLLTSQFGFQLRNIPIQIDGNPHTAVITFAPTGKILDFYLGLELNQYENVMNYNSVVDQTRRAIILNFIENFRTAYVRKDIDFIEKVFSDQALIITGRVIRTENINTDNIRSNLSEKQIEYQVHTKQEYVTRLQTVFRNNPYIILHFNDIEVIPHRKFPNFYGVQLDQRWIASNYQDQGYLFLLIQFRDDDFPLIWVRTWQDAKDFAKDETLGFHNFKIYEGAIH